MANLFTDDGRPWAVDAQRRDEIRLLTDVMIEATSRSGPFTKAEIDELLVYAPLLREATTAQGVVPHPRRKQGAAAPAG